MNALDLKLKEIAAERRVGLMAHMVAGYRTLEESRKVARNLAENGADILEIQIPFSDPTADGPVITEACQVALHGGTTPADALELAREAAAGGTPVLVMSYFNLLFKWPGGLEAFFAEVARAGVSGLIVPDIPPEEKSERYFEGAREAGLHPIVLVSPNVSGKRLSQLKPFASGLVYATARVGTTGASSDIEERSLRDFLGKVKAEFELPVALGFGIGEREQIEALRGIAEVAVVGTRLLRTLKEEGLEALYSRVKELSGKN